MRIPFIWIILFILMVAFVGLTSAYMIQRTELKRVTTNQNNLLSENYVLNLSNKEFKQGFKRQTQIIDSLGLKLRRVIFSTQTVTVTKDSLITVFRDSITVEKDTLKCMQFSTPHLVVSGCLDNKNKFKGFYSSTDTITQIIHRVPRKFLFIKYGTKGIEQTVVSSNPNSIISYKNYIELKK